MSSNQGNESDVESVAREQFEPARGSVPQEIDVADEKHPVKQALGESSHRKLKAHEGTLGQRFAFRYSRSEAFLREYLANAETGCIRAARYELKQVDESKYTQEWFDSHTIPELLDEAREVAGYHPIIETHASPEGASRDRFVIQDNAIGISVNEFIALKELGLSASHDEGGQLGQFGQGVMSVFNAVGEYGELTLETWSRKDEANYRMRFRIDGFNDLPGKRNEYGTTWKIPAFSDEASDMDIGEAIEEYTAQMYVPVLHHEYNEEGEEVAKEEYTYSPLSDLVPDDKPAFVYEDDFVEAVMSPAIDDPQTYLVSQPIERGCSTKSFEAPFKFHLRVKKEDGSIYKSTHEDEDHVGIVPVEDARFENELIKDRNAIYPDQLVPGDLVGYDIDDNDYLQIPSGVDDELVEARDDLKVVEFNDELNHPDTDPELNPVVVDGPHKGTQLVDEETWHNMESDVESQYIPYSELNVASSRDLSISRDGKQKQLPTGLDVKTVQPVDDRDRFEDHDGSMMKAVSVELYNVILEDSQKLFQKIADNGFDEFYNFDTHERDLFTISYNVFIGRNGKPTGQVVRKRVEDVYGIDIDSHLADQLAVLSRKVEFARRNSPSPNRKSGRSDRKISDIIRKAGADGDVYMGATVHYDKARLAWALHDRNQVVAVDGSHRYDEYSDLLGWVPLKTLSLRNIDENYDVDYDIAQELERDPRSSGHGGGVSIDDLEAASREIKIRSDKKGRYKSSTPKDVKQELNGDKGSVRDERGAVEHLLVFRQTDVSGIGVGSKACIGSIARTVVPNYVADYLEDVDRCYVVDGSDYDPELAEIRSQMLDTTYDVVNIEPMLSVEHSLDSQTDEHIIEVEADSSGTYDLETNEKQLRDLGSETIGIILNHQIGRMLDEDSGVSNDTVYSIITESLADSDLIDESITQLVVVDREDIDRAVLGWSPLRIDKESPKIVRHKDASYSNDWSAKRWRPSRSIKLRLLFPEDRFDRDTPGWDVLIDQNEYTIKKGRKKGKTIVDVMHHMAEHLPDDVPVFPNEDQS